ERPCVSQRSPGLRVEGLMVRATYLSAERDCKAGAAGKRNLTRLWNTALANILLVSLLLSASHAGRAATSSGALLALPPQASALEARLNQGVADYTLNAD